MKYEGLSPIARDEALKALEEQDRDLVSTTLVRLALHDENRSWLEELLVRFMQHPDPGIRGVAATCVGHVARIHREVDRHSVIPRLESLLDDPETAGRARDALDDIEVFVSREK